MKSNKCLLVIDAQKGFFNLPVPLFNSEAVLNNITGLIESARKNNVPVILEQHCGKAGSPFEKGTVGWQLHELISPIENEYLLEKKYADSFQETELEDLLKKLDIEKLVICGFATEGCVDTTIRRAASLGYKIETASDAHSTTDSLVLKAEQIIAHHNEVFKIFSEVKTSRDILF